MNGRQIRDFKERRPDIILPWGLQEGIRKGEK